MDYNVLLEYAGFDAIESIIVTSNTATRQVIQR